MSTLPPEIPLTDKDLEDRLLQPIVIAPANIESRDHWEVLIREDLYNDNLLNLAEVFDYIWDHHDELGSHTYIYRHREGDWT